MFFLKALQKQKATLEKKVENEKIIMNALPELSVQILDFARQHGRVSIGEITKLTGTHRNTLKQHFRMLVEKSYFTS
ncbi:MAG: hypothetical protein IPL22_09435 [Bacteroidetes bacterium]|nr:hypothetical protein [Bacteroidota bacterium]